MTNAPIKVQSFLTGKIHQIHRNELMGSLRGRKKALFMTQQASGTGMWINGVPSKEHMLSAWEFRVASKIRYGLRQSSDEDVGGRSFCPCTGGELVEPLLHHGLSCVKGGLWHLRDKRHNKIRDILYKWVQKRGIQVNREVPLNAFGSTQSCYTNNQLNGRDRTPAQGGGGTLSRRGSLPVRSAGRMYDVSISRSRSVEGRANNPRPKVMDLMVNWEVTNIMWMFQ